MDCDTGEKGNVAEISNQDRLSSRTKLFYGVGVVGKTIVKSAVLSDRTTSRSGRRRAYRILGALPLALGVSLLGVVPATGTAEPSHSTTWIVFWIVGTFMLFDTLWTLTNVPYDALTAELTEGGTA